MSGRLDTGLGCPWELASALAGAASLEQVAVALTAVLARRVRAGAAALLVRTRTGVRIIDAQGPELDWLDWLAEFAGRREGGAVGGRGGDDSRRPRGAGDRLPGTTAGLPELRLCPPDAATLAVPCSSWDLVLALQGVALDFGWLRTNESWLAQVIRAAVERTATEDDEGQALVTLSHEMRTPLTTIKGYASSLLRDDVSWQAAEIADYARLIDEESDTLIQMISEILEASLQRIGPLQVQREPVLLDKLTLACVDQAERRDPLHVYVRSLPASLPPVLGDPSRLRQVLANLLDNAVKYASPGLVVVSAYDAGEEVVVSVADEGPGLRPEHVNRLFERYFRVEQPGGNRVAGTGLGLPLARGIIDRLGGRIWATSEVGKGTTISFSVPKVQDQEGRG